MMKTLFPSFFLLIVGLLLAGPARADTETKLYQSCMVSEKGDALCRCQARRWASGRIENPRAPGQFTVIDDKYIDQKITNWHPAPGYNPAGKDGVAVSLSINIMMACGQEIGDAAKK